MIDSAGVNRGSSANTVVFMKIRRQMYLAYARGDEETAFKYFVELMILSYTEYDKIQREFNRTHSEREATDTL